ncbi:MAG: DUF3558 domain-containing protein [Acidobacteriota bacterium]|nr:DUF3558 domain-containing protein [Acidobacteriota bacterium]
MRQAAIILFICSLITAQGCSNQATNQPAPAQTQSTSASSTPGPVNMNATPYPSTTAATTKIKVDACSLLTSAEIQAVQGEPLKETKPNEQASGNLITALCYYELPTPSNSISLSLTMKNPETSGGQSLKEFWENTFGKSEGKDKREREKNRGAKKNGPQTQSENREREGEEEESAPLETVRGIGDEAFWSGTRVGGALYVLKGDRYLRISVGGPRDNKVKLKKSKTLAQRALRRL